MKRLSVFLGILAAIIIMPSCNKFEVNKDLVHEVEGWIDMSQSNKFNPSRLIGSWTLDNVAIEKYWDGELVSSEKVTYVKFPDFSLFKDGVVYRDESLGKWTYAHNFIIWEFYGGFYSCEVMQVTPDKLVIRSEDYPCGCPITTFYEDKSGSHEFFVYEFTRSNKIVVITSNN